MDNHRLFHLRRRTLIKGLLSTGAFGLTSQFWTGCAPSISSKSRESPEVTVPTITMGFIYVGPTNDFGYNQSHAEAVAQMAADFPNIEIVEEASVPETSAVEETIRNMIEIDGATVIFPTSWGYFDPFSLKLAEEFPGVQFFHPNHPLEDTYPKNMGSYFSSLIEPAYLSGIVAGMTSKSGKLGLVVPKSIPVVLQEMNSFFLGARSVNPEVIAQAIVTGEWSLPVKEAEATNSLIDQGADVIITRVDSPKVVMTTAKKRGAYCCGYHVSQLSAALGNYLTGVEWNWQRAYSTYAEMITNSKTLMDDSIPKAITGGLKEEFSKISDYGSAVPEDAKMAVQTAKSALLAGNLTIFSSGLKDNRNNVVISQGDAFKVGDPRLNSINWFVEGISENL